MNIDTLLFGETVQDQRGNVRRDFGLRNMVVWGLIIALIYTYSGRKRGKRRQRGGESNGSPDASDDTTSNDGGRLYALIFALNLGVITLVLFLFFS